VFWLVAAAAEGGSAGGPFEGDVGNVLWTLIIFGLVIFVLGKYAWKPLLAGLQSREEFIRSSLASAKRDRDEAEARLKEYMEKLQGARSEASAIVDEGRRDAEAVKRKIMEEAQHEATQTLERVRREISIAKDTAVKDLYTVAARLASDTAARIVRREINPTDHERLVAESIAELGERFGRPQA
jgi:F-type H+-transporting ATPase subunit b